MTTAGDGLARSEVRLAASAGGPGVRAGRGETLRTRIAMAGTRPGPEGRDRPAGRRRGGARPRVGADGAEAEDLHRLGDVDGDVDLVAVDFDDAVVAGSGEVGLGGLAGLVGFEGDRAAGAVAGKVDSLRTGARRGLGFVDGFHACGEG